MIFWSFCIYFFHNHGLSFPPKRIPLVIFLENLSWIWSGCINVIVELLDRIRPEGTPKETSVPADMTY